MGVESFHDDCRGAKRGKNVMFRVEGDGLRLVHLGDLGHLLTPGQIAALGPVAEFERTAPNALPLDICRCTLDGELIAENM